MSKENTSTIKITTPTFRASFASLFKPRSPFKGQDPVYSVEMLFPKKDGDKWLKEAILKAANAEWGSKDKWPKNFKSPIKDGDEKELDGYKDHFFITCKSKNKPGLVDKELQEIIEEGEFYSGCYARATIVVKAYSQAGNNGVSCYLQNVQKIKDGPAFSGRKNAKDDFEVIEDLNEDASGSQSDDDLDF